MSNEIKPCPECADFKPTRPPQCFQFPEEYGIKPWRNRWTILCPECLGDFGGTKESTHSTRDEAVAAWNAGVDAWIAGAKERAGAERGAK